MGDQSRQPTWAGEVGTGVVSLHPAGKWAGVGIPGPTDRAQPLVHVQLWPLIPAGKLLQAPVRSHTGLVARQCCKSFLCPASFMSYVYKQVDSAPSSEVTVSYSLGHCRQSFVFLYRSLWL